MNGVKVINMAQLVQLVDACTEPFLHFHLDYDQKVRQISVCLWGGEIARFPVMSATVVALSPPANCHNLPLAYKHPSKQHTHTDT